MLKLNIMPPMAQSPNDIRLGALRNGKHSRENEAERLAEVAKEFEALMVEMMIKSMRQNVPESPLFGESNAREIFQDMLDGEYARLMVNRTGFGISESLVRQLGKKL